MSEIGTQNRSRIEIRVRFKGKLYEINAESEPKDVQAFAFTIERTIDSLREWVTTVNLEEKRG